MVYLRYTYCSMKGLNICNWTRVGDAALCGKSCCGTYCKNHLFKIRKGSKIPAPCRSCGRGVQSDIQLCRSCGRDKVRHRHISLEKRARDQFSLVLADLAVRNLHLESGLVGCIPAQHRPAVGLEINSRWCWLILRSETSI